MKFRMEILSPQIVMPPPATAQMINNCPLASRIFEGRTGILNQMQDFFSTKSDNQHIFLLHGLGGAGKTQIALRFIEQASSGFSNIFMMDATTTETIEADFQRIALAKNSGSTMPDALKWLVSTPEEWLLVFDSADDPKMNLNHFFPRCKHGNILITSRNPGLHVYAGSDSLVSDMEETDAVNLLLKSASESDADENKEIATEIVKTLCYLPLAIIQAGAFISKSGALHSYLSLYVSNKVRLLSEKPMQSHDDYSWTVYTTWQISFNQLSPPAAMLLQLCSFLHHQGIFEEIFSNASSYEFPSHGPTEEELEQPLEFLSQFLDPGGVWDPLQFINITSEISAYSLITLNPQTKYFSIHPLVHEWTRSVLSDEEACHNCMCAILGMGISEIPYWDMTLASLRLLPHVDSILHKEDAPKFDFDREFSKVYYYSERNEDALNLHAKVLHKRRNIFGNEHPDTLDAMAWLASTYQGLGQFTEAAELEVVVLEKRRRILGDDHPDTLITMGNLASTYDKLGQFTEAEELEVVVLEKQWKILGDDHPDTLITMGHLALTYYSLERFHEGAELEVVVLEKRRKILGDDHPDTLLAMGNLAFTFYQLGQLKEAQELQVVVLEKRTQILGPDHPHTLVAREQLEWTDTELGSPTGEIEALIPEIMGREDSEVH
ncbi:P-loop containing nucleoside triphosphate hydrolase protein [Mycena crocata]|nr:P-loop containing nucleoside triphosphate hydrolase protein [Mycena crocata]